MEKKGIALIGFGEALSAAEVAWSLVDAGFEVAAFARKGRDSALRHSRFVTVCDVTAPETDHRAAARELTTILESMKDTGLRVLVPLDDSALWLCSRVSVPKACALAAPPGPDAGIALNKSRQVALARTAGFSVPPTLEVSTKEDLLNLRISFPVMLKPANAVIEREGKLAKGKNYICGDRAELQSAAEQWRERYPLLVQPLLDGRGEGVFGLATPQGITALSGHRRLRMMNPHGSGSSACVSQPVSEALKPAVQNFVSSIGWTGLFMIELLRDHAGTAWFMEFNGRPWGSMALARRKGFEYPAWAAELALNPNWQVQRGAPLQREIVCRNLGRELMHLLFVFRGRKSAAIKQWPSFWRSMASVLFLRPGDCLYNFRRDDLHVFFSDCFCTVRDQVFKRGRREVQA